ncbi:phage tail tape measure protein, partial [Helicobacter sp. 12S02232-10]|uniref:phage tail tape measure protein n=1 Tax=Helicobacter sp. 12S02232-10 TaxID=1476197 RepID=UPI000BA64F5C
EDIQNNPQEAIKDLFHSLNDLDDSERFGVISEIFGKKMANDINSAKDGIKAFEKALESSKESAGALQKAVDRAAGDGFGDSIFMLNAAWSEFKKTIGDIFIPYLKIGFDLLRKTLSVISNFIKNSDLTQWAILGSVSIFALGKSIGLIYTSWRAFGLTSIVSKAFGFTLKALKIITTSLNLSFKLLNWSLKSLYSGFKIASFGVSVFSKIFRVSMWNIKGALISTGIGALIVGLGLAIEYIASNWESIYPRLIGVWERIKEGIAPITDWFKGIFDWISNGIAGIIDSISSVTDFLGITDSKEVNLNQKTTIAKKGLIDETLAKRNENQQKMLSQITNSNHSKQINDYKTITINTNTNPQAIAQTINSYRYDDDF